MKILGLRAAVAAAMIAMALAEERTPGPTEDKAELVRWLLAHQDDLRDVSFSDVVHAATGKCIIPVRPREDAAWLQKLGRSLDAALVLLNAPNHPIHRVGRINEASHYIEDEVRRQINRLPGWKCTIPLTAKGRELRSGYPDLRVVTDSGMVIYLDPKLYQGTSRQSSLRTFYYEPRMLTGKIQEDARHMIIGVEHEGTNAASMELKKWELIDVSRLRVSLKAEFQTGNADIYKAEMIVGHSSDEW